MLNTIFSFVQSNFTNLSTAQSLYLALVAFQVSLMGPYLIWSYQSKTGIAVFIRTVRHTSYQHLGTKGVWMIAARFAGAATMYLGSLFMMHWYAVLMVSIVLCLASTLYMSFTLARVLKEPREESQQGPLPNVA
jgi:VIT1/CCC1 family predicted Fe2+/Mn2+ transporter